MKTSSKNTRPKSKCPHKPSKSPYKPKTTRYHTTNSDTDQPDIIHPSRTFSKQIPLQTNSNRNHNNYELCKQATLCYYGMKELIRLERVEKDSERLREQNKKLKEENMVYGEYFRQFEKRFAEQKEEIKKLRDENHSLKSRNAKIQQLNSTLSGNTHNPRSYSQKQSLTTRSTAKYLY